MAARRQHGVSGLVLRSVFYHWDLLRPLLELGAALGVETGDKGAMAATRQWGRQGGRQMGDKAGDEKLLNVGGCLLARCLAHFAPWAGSSDSLFHVAGPALAQ